MNMLALISAIAGLLILSLVVVLGNKVKNRWLRYVSIVVGIVLALVVTGNVPALLGDAETYTSAKAGEYMLYLGVLVVIIKSMFFKKPAIKK